MKKAKSETQFDQSDFTCPFLDGKCRKDCCTHFERFDGSHDYFTYKEKWNSAICHAGQYVQLWYESIITKKPPVPRTWEDLLAELSLIILGIIIVFFIAYSSVK
jgi:hypothetical protein